jgi:hypothetical protein
MISELWSTSKRKRKAKCLEYAGLQQVTQLLPCSFARFVLCTLVPTVTRCTCGNELQNTQVHRESTSCLAQDIAGLYIADLIVMIRTGGLCLPTMIGIGAADV